MQRLSPSPRIDIETRTDESEVWGGGLDVYGCCHLVIAKEWESEDSVPDIAELMQRLCREPDLLADFRRDPNATARRIGVPLPPPMVETMLGLEEDAVTDVVLAPPEAIRHD